MAASPAIDLDAVFVSGPVPLDDWLAVLPPVWCILIGAVLTMLRRRTALQAPVAVAGLMVLVLIDVLLLAHVSANGPVTLMVGRWLPPFGIAFTVDLTGALFALTAAIVSLPCAFAARRDIGQSSVRYGFYPMLMLLMAGVSGAFLTGDIFNLYVWFEVMLIASFGLIVNGAQPGQIDGAVKYGFLNLVATTLFLIATAFLYGIFGTLNMADIAMKAATVGPSAPLVTLTALYLLAFGMKSAAFPLQFWLPASYHTPDSTVSALFAALMTKVGLYAMLRLSVMLFPVEREALSVVLALVGASTMLVGALGALAMADIRRLFGFLVISGVGAMIAGIAMAGPGGIAGTIFYALHSMVTMAALYLLAGAVGALAGGFSLNDIAGLYRRDGWLAALALMLFVSVSGLPPFSGFWPKVMLVTAAVESGAGWLAAVLLASGFLTMIATMRVFLLVWWRPAETTVDGSPLSPDRLLPLATLVLISLGVGLYPEPLLHAIEQAASGLVAPDAYLYSVFPQGGMP